VFSVFSQRYFSGVLRRGDSCSRIRFMDKEQFLILTSCYFVSS